MLGAEAAVALARKGGVVGSRVADRALARTSVLLLDVAEQRAGSAATQRCSRGSSIGIRVLGALGEAIHHDIQSDVVLEKSLETRKGPCEPLS